jgi:O-methyltransferase involved in polyketide biosynthesis
VLFKNDPMLNQPLTEYLQTRLQKDQRLLDTIKAKLPDLERLLVPFQVTYEEGIYRFYHHSFKVYQLQHCTLQAVEIFKSIASDNQLCEWFEQIVTAGTGQVWEQGHNLDWTLHTRPIVEAFLHTKYFLEMMIKYGREMDTAATILPTGWAAILELYNQR